MTIQESVLEEFAPRLAELEPEQRDELIALLDFIPERELAGLRADLRSRQGELVAAP